MEWIAKVSVCLAARLWPDSRSEWTNGVVVVVEYKSQVKPAGHRVEPIDNRATINAQKENPLAIGLHRLFCEATVRDFVIIIQISSAKSYLVVGLAAVAAQLCKNYPSLNELTDSSPRLDHTVFYSPG